MLSFSPEEQWALALSTFAGLSTTIGAAFAVIVKPGDALLAFLLGTAIGVMLLLSVAEMWVHNAMEHGWPGVTAAVVAGAALYHVAQPFLPDFKYDEVLVAVGTPAEQAEEAAGKDSAAAAVRPVPAGAAAGVAAQRIGDSLGVETTTTPKGGRKKAAARQNSGGAAAAKAAAAASQKKRAARLRAAELLRLGLLMAFTMTLHNLPEGFAVAFAAFTDFGPVMAVAIAVHNIPEGVIVAAPVFAATGSRWAALVVATASGLSEPLGAVLALVAVKPYLTEELLHYILAFVGGIMAAVCVLELWPEARKCRADRNLAAGVALGAGVMAWTLAIGV